MDYTRLIDRYCEVWSEPDKERRAHLLSDVWSPGGAYTDPTIHARGCDELLLHIEKVLAKRPGTKVRRTSKVDAHHGVARFAWRAFMPDGTTLPEGLDIAFISADGTKIERILGFFGTLER
jgi:hypothetical protein